MDGASGMEGVSTGGLTHPRSYRLYFFTRPYQPHDLPPLAALQRQQQLVGSNNRQRWGGGSDRSREGKGSSSCRGGVGINNPQRWGGEQQTAEDESETVLMIRELLETRIRPAVQEDGGDIDFVDFDEATGIVYLRMTGACSGCPSSSVILKSGVESMLTHYIPEVNSVKEVIEEAE
ncbi:unnamed protein product [Closterium sp. NIES-65]|nr:unnamed protein product [Closterium sp. NIES-65]